MGHGGGNKHEGQDGEIGQHVDTTPSSTDTGEQQRGRGERGRSESSPGHLKKASGAQSARDYAPGRAPGSAAQRGASGEEGSAGRARRGTILSEVAPDEAAES